MGINQATMITTTENPPLGHSVPTPRDILYTHPRALDPVWNQKLSQLVGLFTGVFSSYDQCCRMWVGNVGGWLLTVTTWAQVACISGHYDVMIIDCSVLIARWLDEVFSELTNWCSLCPLCNLCACVSTLGRRLCLSVPVAVCGGGGEGVGGGGEGVCASE